MFGIIFKIRAAIVISVISWLLFAASSSLVVFVHFNRLQYEFALHLPKFFYVIFFLSIYVFFRLRIRRKEHLNLTDLLWKVFASGLVATVISMLLQLLRNSLSDNKFVNNDYFDSIIFDINVGVLTTFLISTFVVWERLIFYQKTKMLIYSWRVFVYFMLGTLAITFFKLDIIGQRYQYAIGSIIIISIYYSFNLKWVAYLNSREKLRSILLIFLTVAYLGYFIYIFLPYYNRLYLNIYLSDVTLLIMFGFVITYGFIALLVLLFNLPTSPVF